MYVNAATAPAMLPRVRNLQRPARPKIIPTINSATRCNAPPPLVGRRAGVRRGLAGPLDPQSQQIASIAATGVSTAAGILVSLGTIGGPVGAAIAGLVSIGMLIANQFGGCGQTCVEATKIADQVGALLDQMLQTYLAAPVHYKSMQTAYLTQWDAAWTALEQACGNPQLGDAGVRCITDRQRGSCKWNTSPGGWQQTSGTWTYVAPGPAGSGSACWNWFVGSRDPVANDPTVVPDPPAASSVLGAPGAALSDAVSSLTSGNFNPLWIGGAVLLAGIWLFMGDN
jgi:hypothetical protein